MKRFEARIEIESDAKIEYFTQNFVFIFANNVVLFSFCYSWVFSRITQ